MGGKRQFRRTEVTHSKRGKKPKGPEWSIRVKGNVAVTKNTGIYN